MHICQVLYAALYSQRRIHHSIGHTHYLFEPLSLTFGVRAPHSAAKWASPCQLQSFHLDLDTALVQSPSSTTSGPLSLAYAGPVTTQGEKRRERRDRGAIHTVPCVVRATHCSPCIAYLQVTWLRLRLRLRLLILDWTVLFLQPPEPYRFPIRTSPVFSLSPCDSHEINDLALAFQHLLYVRHLPSPSSPPLSLGLFRLPWPPPRGPALVLSCRVRPAPSLSFLSSLG